MGGAYSWIQEKMAKEEPVYDFPNTLEGFGYHFNQDGQLRHVESDEPFKFIVKEGNHHYNQKHYNALGDVITEKVYQMMEKDYKLQRSYLPVNAEECEPQTFVFISGDLFTNPDKMMILIHGSGVVRAGQWARRLIINDCLDSGTQLPYIRWARENGYALIIANTNLNTAEPKENKKRKPVSIKGNGSPEEHTETIWREFAQRCSAKHIAIVAHSYGGICALELTKNHFREFEERVFAIALTDSVHGLKQKKVEPEVVGYYKQRVINWASAYDPLDAPLITTSDEVPTVSAGTDKHENTSYSSMHSIFKFFKDKYEETVNPLSKRVGAGPPDTDTKLAPADTPIPIIDQREDTKGKLTDQTTNQNAGQAQMDQSTTESKTGQSSAAKTESNQSENLKESHQSSAVQTESNQSENLKESDQSSAVQTESNQSENMKESDQSSAEQTESNQSENLKESDQLSAEQTESNQSENLKESDQSSAVKTESNQSENLKDSDQSSAEQTESNQSENLKDSDQSSAEQTESNQSENLKDSDQSSAEQTESNQSENLKDSDQSSAEHTEFKQSENDMKESDQSKIAEKSNSADEIKTDVKAEL